MPCTLEINSNDGFKRGHVESYSSVTKNITCTTAIHMARLMTYLIFQGHLIKVSCDFMGGGFPHGKSALYHVWWP